MLQRMEAQDEEFGSRLRALERLSGGEGRRREEDRHDQRRGRRGRRWGGGGDSAGAGRGVKVYGRCPRRPVSNPESRFDSESPKPPLNVNSSCAPSPPAGPAWLKPCRHFSTAPRRRHHRQPRDRPAGEYRAPPRRVTFIEGSITDLDLLMETFPGADGIFGGDPLGAPVGEGSARLERGERYRDARRARRGEGLRGAGRHRGVVLLGLRRHPGRTRAMACPARR